MNDKKLFFTVVSKIRQVFGTTADRRIGSPTTRHGIGISPVDASGGKALTVYSLNENAGYLL